MCLLAIILSRTAKQPADTKTSKDISNEFFSRYDKDNKTVPDSNPPKKYTDLFAPYLDAGDPATASNDDLKKEANDFTQIFFKGTARVHTQALWKWDATKGADKDSGRSNLLSMVTNTSNTVTEVVEKIIELTPEERSAELIKLLGVKNSNLEKDIKDFKPGDANCSDIKQKLDAYVAKVRDGEAVVLDEVKDGAYSDKVKEKDKFHARLYKMSTDIVAADKQKGDDLKKQIDELIKKADKLKCKSAGSAKIEDILANGGGWYKNWKKCDETIADGVEKCKQKILQAQYDATKMDPLVPFVSQMDPSLSGYYEPINQLQTYIDYLLAIRLEDKDLVEKDKEVKHDCPNKSYTDCENDKKDLEDKTSNLKKAKDYVLGTDDKDTKSMKATLSSVFEDKPCWGAKVNSVKYDYNKVIQEKNLVDLTKSMSEENTLLLFSKSDFFNRGDRNTEQRACVYFNRIKNMTLAKTGRDFVTKLIAEEGKDDELTPFVVNMKVAEKYYSDTKDYSVIRSRIINELGGAIDSKDDKMILALLNLLKRMKEVDNVKGIIFNEDFKVSDLKDKDITEDDIIAEAIIDFSKAGSASSSSSPSSFSFEDAKKDDNKKNDNKNTDNKNTDNKDKYKFDVLKDHQNNMNNNALKNKKNVLGQVSTEFSWTTFKTLFAAYLDPAVVKDEDIKQKGKDVLALFEVGSSSLPYMQDKVALEKNIKSVMKAAVIFIDDKFWTDAYKEELTSIINLSIQKIKINESGTGDSYDATDFLKALEDGKKDGTKYSSAVIDKFKAADSKELTVLVKAQALVVAMGKELKKAPVLQNNAPKNNTTTADQNKKNANNPTTTTILTTDSRKIHKVSDEDMKIYKRAGVTKK